MKSVSISLIIFVVMFFSSFSVTSAFISRPAIDLPETIEVAYEEHGPENEVPEELIGPEPDYSHVPHRIFYYLKSYADKYELPLEIVVRLSAWESGHGKHKRSLQNNANGSYDIGVLALNSQYIDFFAKNFFEGDPTKFDPYNPHHNIQTGLAYLKYLEKRTGDLRIGLLAYNCGIGRVESGSAPASSITYVNRIYFGDPNFNWTFAEL